MKRQNGSYRTLDSVDQPNANSTEVPNWGSRRNIFPPSSYFFHFSMLLFTHMLCFAILFINYIPTSQPFSIAASSGRDAAASPRRLPLAEPE